jgi:hypothetical protein
VWFRYHDDARALPAHPRAHHLGWRRHPGTPVTELRTRVSAVIGHRLDGIRRADLIVVLRDGSIAEQGSHDALMRSDGEYARLFRTQAQGFLNPVR